MRGKTLVALSILCLTGLSGCLGFGDDPASHEHDDHCDEHGADGHEECQDLPAGNNGTNNETQEPNVPPVAVLTMTDGEGNMLDNTTAIMEGQTITFHANGSMDSDGVLELAALTIEDGNGSRTFSMLQDGAFQNITLTFDVAGRVVAVLRVMDNDGDGAAAFNITYVNEMQTKENDLTLPAPAAGVGDCAGPGAGEPLNSSVLDSPYSNAETFTVPNGTRWISASSTGSVVINICGPDGTKISEGSAASSASTGGGGFAPGVGYWVFVKATEAQAEYSVSIIPHFEPKPE